MTNTAQPTGKAQVTQLPHIDLGVPADNKAIERAEEDIEKTLAREVVMALSRGNLLLQSGSYLTESDLETDREFMRSYEFRYLKRRS